MFSFWKKPIAIGSVWKTKNPFRDGVKVTNIKDGYIQYVFGPDFKGSATSMDISSFRYIYRTEVKDETRG